MRFRFGASILAGLLLAPAAFADDASSGMINSDEGRLLATGGVSAVEGEGGGGLAPWALITG
jgi:hypothetical protein